jgi:hypothetical protein
MVPLYADGRATRYRHIFTLSRELDTGRSGMQMRGGVPILPQREGSRLRHIEVGMV